MLHRAARNAYSWWWASHIRTKQSKYLDQNLQDMGEKVEYILKIINEDGDSFAVRAEMYYRKRPELVNFVEDCFRNYRALAERYDHLSKELQSANRTLATVYPERLQLEMDEDEEIFSTSFPPSPETKQPPKSFPAAPKLSIPKISSVPKKNSKAPSRLMSKKGLLKISATDAPQAAKSSGLSKEEAIQEIDKVQKGILALQTEKEFVKSSYESGLAKYWEIENQVTEMQKKVSSLEDEFGIGTVIEDDEARNLMASTALKSCHETLARLRERQEELTGEAQSEHQRIQEAREKFKMLYGKNNTSPKLKDSIEEESSDMEFLRAKIKDKLLVNADVSLTVSELAENIDELVDTVIILETGISSQMALVKRLRSEANELEAHLQSLEEDNETLIEGSGNKRNKIQEVEEELGRVQSLNERIKGQNKNLQTQFTEASCNLDHLSKKLPTVKPNEAETMAKQFRVHEDIVLLHNALGISKGAKTDEEGKKNYFAEQSTSVGGDNKEYFLQLHPSNPFVDFREEEELKKDDLLNTITSANVEEVNFDDLFSKDRVKVVSDYNLGEGFEEHQDMTACGQDSVISEDVKMGGERKHFDDLSGMTASKNDMEMGERENADPFKTEENFVQSNPKDQLDDLSSNDQLRAAPETNLENRCKADESMMAPGNNSTISRDQKTEGKEKKDDLSVDSDAQELGTDEEDEPNWKELFLNGLEDREKILLREYTSVLRNYKEVKKKLSEAEKKNRASLFKSTVQIKVLKNANSSKDVEIQSLHTKLNSFKATPDETPKTHKSIPGAEFKIPNTSSPNSDQMAALDLSDERRVVSMERTEEPTALQVTKTPCTEQEEDEIKVISVDEPHSVSSVEEKIRLDIDDLLEENIEFWLRFSTSFHQIQKFQTSFQDLQGELRKLKENKKQEGSTKQHAVNSDAKAIYRHIREIQTELNLWLEHNGMLKDDLQNRLSSLSSIQDEISRLSTSAPEVEETELSDFQAAKFHGEVMNMKQENNKVSGELLAGLERVKRLKVEIEKTVEKLEEELGMKNQQPKSSSMRSRIPLKSFLFGVKLKKQKPSLFACMSPSLQKQYSDLTEFQPDSS